MTKTKSFHEQKRYLQIGFVFVFAASFVGILFERARIKEEMLRSAAKKPLPLAEYVKGAAIEPAPGIQDYRDTISANVPRLNQAIDAKLSGEDASGYPLGAIYQNLLAAPVPAPYRSMHAALVVLAQEALKEESADRAALSRRREQLFLAYPWLSIVGAP